LRVGRRFACSQALQVDGGKSGRWESLRKEAEAYAFVLTQMGAA
jgi:hypothetical protein